MYAFTYEDVRTPTNRQDLLSRFQSINWSRLERKNAPNASLLDVDLTHPFLLANDLDLIA
jgi:hypothetical protein